MTTNLLRFDDMTNMAFISKMEIALILSIIASNLPQL
jgi:hypothetical protein